jgi:STE24 endopeptidase
MVIAPLFDSHTRLKDNPLRSAVEALAHRVDYPLKALYVVDGSTRSSHSNAYCYGSGSNRRIVLYDTLLQQMSETEVRDGLPSE